MPELNACFTQQRSWDLIGRDFVYVITMPLDI